MAWRRGRKSDRDCPAQGEERRGAKNRQRQRTQRRRPGGGREEFTACSGTMASEQMRQRLHLVYGHPHRPMAVRRLWNNNSICLPGRRGGQETPLPCPRLVGVFDPRPRQRIYHNFCCFDASARAFIRASAAAAISSLRLSASPTFFEPAADPGFFLSPSFNLQGRREAGGGHYVAFMQTELGVRRGDQRILIFV